MSQLDQDTTEFTGKYAGLLHLSPDDPGFKQAADSYHRAMCASPRIDRVVTALDLYQAALESEHVKAHFILLMLVVDRLFSPGLRSNVVVRHLRDKIGRLLGEPVPGWVTEDYRMRNRMLYGTPRDEKLDMRTLRDEVCPRWRNLLRSLLREILVKDKVSLFRNTSTLRRI